MVGLYLTPYDLPETKAAVERHWFELYFDQLNQACAEIAADDVKWTDSEALEALGNLADNIVTDGDLIISGHQNDGKSYVDIPFTPETLLDGDLAVALALFSNSIGYSADSW